MNIDQAQLKTWQPIKAFSTFVLFSLLTACSGSSSDDSTSVNDDSESNVQSITQTIDVSQVRSLEKSSSSRIGAMSTGVSDFVESGTLNSTGEFSHPNAADQFTGTLTAAFEVSDEQGIARVFLAFAQSDLELPICEENCGDLLGAVVTGINPVLFELISGEQTLQVWLEDNEGNLDLVDTVNINWQAKVINGVSASYDEENESINVSWNTLADMLRYNVYLATDSALNGRNVLELEGGDTRLALTTTSTSFAEKPIDNYFIVVTGVDGTGESGFSTQVQLINDLTQTPTANNDAFETQEDTILSGNLLTNDLSGAEELLLDTDLVSQPTLGTITISDDGTFTYTPNSNANGSDQFSYQVENEFGLTAQAIVTVTITPENDAPIAFDDSFLIDSDLSTITISASELLVNDTDIDGDLLTVSGTLITAPQFGNITLSEDGAFIYTPSDSFVNIDTFEYQISDAGLLTDSAIVTITTADFNGHIPVAANDAYSVNEDEVLVVTVDQGILVNDSDTDNTVEELAISVLTAAQNGSVIIANDGSFDYSPLPNFNGEDSFSYQITDPNGNQAAATVTISVVAQNDAPTANNNTYILSAGSTFTLSDLQGILANDSDVDGDEIKLSTFNDTEIISSTNNTINTTSGSIIISELGGFSYTPDSDFEGTDSVTYQISDGSLISASATVQFIVNDGYFETDNSTPITLLDLKNDFVEILLTTDDVSAENGTLTIENEELIYTPTDGFVGADFITISLTIIDSDDVETTEHIQYYVNITSTNTAPTANPDTASVLLFQTTNIDVLANDTDPENDELTVISQSALNGIVTVNSDGTLAYTPDDDAASDIISYTIRDSDGLTSSSTVTVAINNTAPTANADSANAVLYQTTNIDVLANDTDPESDDLIVISFSALNGSLSLNSDHTIAYTPNDDATSDTISYTIQDSGGLTSSSTVAVSISDAAALGEHDIDKDGVTDLSITQNDDLTVWSLNFISDAALVIKEVNGRYYPIEPNTDTAESNAEISVSDDASTHDYKVIMGNAYYEVKLSDMATSGIIALNRVATALSTDIDTLLFPADFMSVQPAPNGGTTFHTATANKKYITGETYKFNDDGTGRYADHKENQTFTWTSADNVIEVVVDKTSETFTVRDLYSEGIISETVYNDYIDNGNDEYTEYDLSINELKAQITIDENVLAYINATEKVTTTYTLPDILGGDTAIKEADEDSLRWYNKQTLSLNSFSPLDNDGEWLIPIPDTELDLTSTMVLTETVFSNDNSGLMTRLDTGDAETFTWSFNGDGQLNVDTPTLSLTYHFFGELSHSQYVLIENRDSNDDLIFSSANLASYRQSVDMEEVSSYLTSGLIVGLQTGQTTENYNESGFFTGEDFFGFGLSNTLSDFSGNTEIYDAQRYIFNESSSFSNSYNWVESGQDISVNRYIDTNEGTLTECDPNLDMYCTEYERRAWQVISYDQENGLVWVIEDRRYIDFSTVDEYPFDRDSVDYTYLFVSRLNAYKALGINNLVDDSATTVEDTLLSSIDVLANDLNSENSATGLTVNGAYSDSGTTTVNEDNRIDFTPSENFYGDAEVVYMVSDGLGAVSVTSLTVTVTAVNDAPEFDQDIATEFNLAENTADGTVIFYPYASDPEGDSITWSLTNEDNVLSIDSSSGEISINDNTTFDYESQTSYEFTVVMTDPSGDSAFQTVTINITNEDDAPELTANISLTLPENQTGAAGYTATASDLEGDAYTISWSDGMGIISSNFDDSNTANDTLELEVVSAFDYEMLNTNYSAYDLDGDSTNGVFEYEFKVAVVQDDDSNLSDSQNVTLYITDVIENTELQLDSNFGSDGIAHFNTYSDIGSNDYLIDATSDDNGNYYMLVLSNDSDSSEDTHYVAKIKSDGTFDLTFGHNGRKQLAPTALNDNNIDDSSYTSLSAFNLNHIKYDVDNSKIYLLGSEMSNSTLEPIIIRLNSTGSIDNTFSSDGKYEVAVNTNDHSEAIDLNIYDNGSGFNLYIASNSTQTSESGEITPASFKLTQIDDTGSLNQSRTYNLKSISGDTDDEYINGIVMNSSGKLVAFGHINNGGDVNLLVSELDIDDLSEGVNDDQGIMFDLGISSTDAEYITTYAQIDSSNLLVAGSMTNTAGGEQDPMVAKIDIDNMTLSTTFSGTDGYYTDTAQEYENQDVIDLSIDNSGNISFISKLTTGCGIQAMIPYQISEQGTLTTLGSNLILEELTNTSGSGITTSENIQARLFYNDGDATNTFTVLSNLEKINSNASSETEIYFEQVDPNSLPTEFAKQENRIDYEFLSFDSEYVIDAISLSTGSILTSTDRYSDFANYDRGYTLSAHDSQTGELSQSFGESTYTGYIQSDGDSYGYLYRDGLEFVELADGNVIYIEQKTDESLSNYYLVVHKYDSEGNAISGFPVTNTIAGSFGISSIDYNATANKIGLFGFLGGEISDVYAATFDPSDGIIAEFTAAAFLGSDMYDDPYINQLTSGIIKDDGTAIALGYGDSDSGTVTFAIKLDEDTNLDQSFDDEANDGNDDDWLQITSGMIPIKMAAMSDGSLIFFGQDTSNNNYGLFKLIASGDYYALDSNFHSDSLEYVHITPAPIVDNHDDGIYSEEISDMAVDNDGNVFLAGFMEESSHSYPATEYYKYGFVAKFNGEDGTAHSTFGNQALPGYYIPAAEADLDSGQNCQDKTATTIVDICDISSFDKIELSTDGSIFIHSTAQSPQNAINTVILKFGEVANDDSPNALYLNGGIQN